MAKVDLKELLEFVQSTEEKASALYSDLATQTTGKAQKLFENLSKDEEKHKSMYGKLISYLDTNQIYEVSNEASDLIKFLMKNDAFQNRNAKEKMVKEEAIMLAEKVEKDGILLYREIKDLFPSLDSELIDTIIEEEKKHLRLVLNMKFNSNLKNLML